jgi:hypothetical protein
VILFKLGSYVRLTEGEDAEPMYADEELLATLSRRSAEAMLARLQELHRESGQDLDQTLAAGGAELQTISDNAKQDAVRELFAIAKAEREAGGVGSERRFDQALKEIDVVGAAWDEAVRAAFNQSLREWVESGEPALGPHGWITVTVTPHERGSIWWTDSAALAHRRTAVARDVFLSVARDDRARSGDLFALLTRSEFSIGGAIDAAADALFGDLQEQQHYDATRYRAHPAQEQAAAGQIAGLRNPWIAGCRAELADLLRYWDTHGRPPV